MKVKYLNYKSGSWTWSFGWKETNLFFFFFWTSGESRTEDWRRASPASGRGARQVPQLQVTPAEETHWDRSCASVFRDDIYCCLDGDHGDLSGSLSAVERGKEDGWIGGEWMNGWMDALECLWGFCNFENEINKVIICNILFFTCVLFFSLSQWKTFALDSKTQNLNKTKEPNRKTFCWLFHIFIDALEGLRSKKVLTAGGSRSLRCVGHVGFHAFCTIKRSQSGLCCAQILVKKKMLLRSTNKQREILSKIWFKIFSLNKVS